MPSESFFAKRYLPRLPAFRPGSGILANAGNVPGIEAYACNAPRNAPILVALMVLLASWLSAGSAWAR